MATAWMLYFNSALNPIIYGVFNPEFRFVSLIFYPEFWTFPYYSKTNRAAAGPRKIQITQFVLQKLYLFRSAYRQIITGRMSVISARSNFTSTLCPERRLQRHFRYGKFTQCVNVTKRGSLGSGTGYHCIELCLNIQEFSFFNSNLKL